MKSRIAQIAVFFGILFLSGPAQAAIVQCVNGKWASGTTFTVAITATTGNMLWGGLTSTASTGGLAIAAGVADTINTYSAIDTVSSNAAGVGYLETTYQAKNITGGSLTITVTYTSVDGGLATGQLVICELSGRDTAAPLDVHLQSALQVNPGGGTDAITSGSVTTTVNGEDVMGISMAYQADADETTGSGYTAANDNSISGWGQGEYLHQSTAGSVAATFTAPVGGTARSFISAIATFKPASAGGSASHRLPLMGVGK